MSADVRWEGFTHAEIYERVRRGPGGAASGNAAAAWQTVEDTLRAVDAQLGASVRQIGVEWEGMAADQARGGMGAMSRWTLDAADNARLTQDGVASQATGADRVRHTMPPPRPALDSAVALGGAGGYVPRATSVAEIERGMAEDRALAVDLMNRYTTASSGNRHLMDYWTPPPTVVVEAVPRTGARAAGSTGPGLGAGGAVVAPAAVGTRPGVSPVGSTGRAAPVPAGPGGGPAGEGRAPGAVGPGGGVAPAGGAAGPGGSPGRGGPPGTDPTARPGGGGAPGLPPVVPGRPGAPGAGPGAGRPPAPSTPRLPRTDLPTEVRPVVPGPPPRAGFPGEPGRTPTVPSGEAPPRGVPPGPLSTGGPAGVGSPAAGRLPGEAAGTARLAAERGGLGAGLLPLGGAPMRSAEQDHRRPDYLVDDADVFADDRWFTPAVLVADDPAEVRP